MNRHAYRVIFNRTRGLPMAVAETVSAGARGAASAKTGKAKAPPLHAMRRLALALAVAFGAAGPGYAQIVADPAAAAARKPLVEATASGLSLVRIAPPSAAGVSHNQYSQFNIGPGGAVLNNATRITQTQLAGYVDGNPNLANGAARIILNEVTGTAPSALRGYAEVAGQRAEVVIANPNGISCNGCGFINASRGVLTTGTPVIGPSGSLDAFRVRRGDIVIEGDGLNGSAQDSVELIARGIRVNGAIWAKNLQLLAGPNRVDYASLALQGIDGEGGPPTLAIDVSRLGGMYADRIRLIGTEAGVGVNHGGIIAAQAGGLAIDAAGKLTLTGDARSGGSLLLAGAQGVDNAGRLYAAGDASLTSSGGAIVNSGSIAAHGDLTLKGASVASSGALGAGVNEDGSIGNSGVLDVSASGMLGATGQNSAGSRIRMQGAALNLSGAVTTAADDIALKASNGDIDLTGARTLATHHAGIEASGLVRNDAGAMQPARLEAERLDIHAGALSNRGGLIRQTGDAAQDITVDGLLDNSGGAIESGATQLRIAATGLNNDGGSIAANGDAALALSGAASNRKGSISGAGLNLDAASLDNDGGAIEARGALRIGVDGMLSNTGTTADGKAASLHGDGASTIHAGALNNSGAISSSDALAIVTGQNLDNQGGSIAAGDMLNIQAGGRFDNWHGQVGAQGITLAAAEIDNATGLISQSGAGDTSLHADARFDNSGGTLESAGANFALHASSLINAGGAIKHVGAGTLSIEADTLSNTDGRIAGNGNVALSATTATNAGSISAQGKLSAQAGALNNDGGLLASNTGLDIGVAGVFTNRAGSVYTGSAAQPAGASITAARIDNSEGEITAGSLTLDADSLGNARGTITQTDAAGSARLTIRQSVDNRGGTLGAAAADLALAPAEQLLNDGGRIIHAGAGKLTIASGKLSNANGDIGSNGVAEIRAGSLDNRGGTLSAAALLDAHASGGIDNRDGQLLGSAARIDAGTGALDNRGGAIQAAGHGLIIAAQSLDNRNGSILGLGHDASTVATQADIDNRGGIIGARGDLNVSAAGITNTAGTISADGHGDVHAGRDIDNAEGTIQAGGDLDIAATGRFINTGGKTRALGQQNRMDVSASDIDNSGGRIVNAGSGDTTLRATRRVLNTNPQAIANAGVIGGNGNVRIDAPQLLNLQGGMLMALGKLTLNTPQSVDNSGGKLMAAGSLELRQSATALTNRDGDISAGEIRIQADTIDNSGGRIANSSDGNGLIDIQAKSVDNAGGDIASAQDLVLRASHLAGAGRILSGRDADITLAGDHDNPAGNDIHANRDLRLAVAGRLANAGTLEAAGNLTLNAASIDNRAGGLIASGSPDAPGTGHTLLNAPGGTIANAGRLEGNFLESHSARLANTGTMLGDHVAISADDIANTGADAIIAAVGRLDLWGRLISNRDGATLYSLGDIRIAADGATDDTGMLIHRAERLDNVSSSIEADGELRVAAETVNNTGPTLRTFTATVGDATWTLNQLPWWSSTAPGRGTPERNANTSRLDAYYLPPEAILSDTPVITPDGYVIHKAVVALSDRDSAFELMEGGLVPRDATDRITSIQYGSQSRVQATAGTQVIYYLIRQDGQANPDQVSGPGAWSAHEAGNGNIPILNTLGSITYSSDYGRCTSNCVRLESLPGYTDPTQTLLKNVERRRPGGVGPGVYPVEVQRIAHQTITETRVEAVDGRPQALMASGGAMSFNIGQALNNDNSHIAAGGDLWINGATSDGQNNALVNNHAITLTRTYTFANRSGYGSASFDNAPPVEWVDWINTPIEQQIGTVGGTITSNAALRIDAKNISNNSVRAAQGPAGASPLALGLDEGIAPLAGSAYGRQSLTAGDTKPVAPAPRIGAPIAIPAAVPRVVDGARAGILVAALPTNGLYRIAPEPSKPYLVQTDARFTSYANFLSSDWMLKRLGIDPGQAQKRLGDGFYEQRQVLNQVTGLTGKRFLAGYASAEEEYLALMTNGLAYAQQFGLEPGIALTDAQMAALTSNMVWLVSETVTLPDGSRQTVLAPQVYLARNAALTPTGALIEGETVAIKTGDLDNTRGTVRGNILAAIQADGAIDNDGGSLLGGDLAIRARSISSASLVDTHSAASKDGVSMISGVSALSRIEATGNMLIDVDGVFSAQGARIAAGKNGSLVAGSVSIGGVQTRVQSLDEHGNLDASPLSRLPFGSVSGPAVGLLAFGNLNTGQGSRYTSASTQNFGSTLSAGGSVSVFSKGSLDFLGSQANVGKSLTMAASGPITIGAEMGSISSQAAVRAPNYTYQESMQADTASGSTLRAGGDIRVLAGAQRDADGTIRFDAKAGNPNAALTVAGSSIQAGLDANGQGAAMLGATGALNVDPTFLAGSYREESRQVIKRRFSTEKDHDLREGSGTGAIGSTISGYSVSMAAGKDMRIAGGSVGATGDVLLAAGGDIGITAARTSETRHTLQEKNQSGIMASGGSLLIGSSSQRDEANASGTFDSRLRGMVGSSEGKVGIAAKGDVRIAGSDVIAGDKIGIVGKNVTIAPGEDDLQSRETHDLKQSGVTVTVGGAIATAARAAAAAVDRSANNGDARIAALQAAKAGMTIANYANAVDAANAANAAAGTDVAKAPTGFKVAIGVGSSRSHSETTTSSQSNAGSTLSSLNGISMLATGSGAKNADGSAADGDIRIAGSQLTSRDIDLAAARDIDLEAVADRFSSHGKNNASSASVGVGFAVGGSQNGVTVELAAASSRGRANTDSTTYQQTGVAASGTLSLSSGRDTNLLGAQVSGESVRASIGRNLSITSTQDTQTVDIKQESAGFNASVCVPPICYGAAVEGSASVGASYTSGTYTSVRQQSGLFAGTGGFDIAVQGKTELTGAAIGSKADTDKNVFSTGTLITRDLQNHVDYDGGSVGVTASTGADSKDRRLQGPVGVTPNIGVGASGSQTGATKSAIAAGTVRITDEAGQQAATGKSADETIATLNRDVANANKTVDKLPDLQKLQQQQQLAQLIGEVGNQGIGLLSQKMGYADGSAEKIALHGVLGYVQAQAAGGNGLAGATAGAAGEWLGTKVDEYLRSNPSLTESQRKAIQQWTAAAVGGVVGGAVGGTGGAQAGAAVGLDAERYNRQLHVTTYSRLKEGCKGSTSTECQTINRIGGVRSGMPMDDAKIPASQVVDNYDSNGKVVSYTLVDRKTNQPTMIMEPLEFATYRNATPGIQALMQTSPQYALDFASAGLYSAAGDNGRAVEHVVAGATSRDYVRDVALGVAGAVGAAATVARPALVVNPAMLDELAANGVKFTRENVVATGRNSNGQVVFLETGNAKSGLQHIVAEHASDFITVGISESEIPSVVMDAVTKGRLVGYQGAGTGRPIYELEVNGQTQRIAISVGDNGYIVGANPTGRVK